ncbi:MAG: hypothetical protein KAI74_01810 [Kiritimatiellae bacterium]|nr:hypothetical protein [Kiritimatiellia bacterium]
MIEKIICWSALIALTILPILLRSRVFRIFSIIVLLFAAHNLLWSGLRLAARNVYLPDTEILKSQVTYADAWGDGLSATQAKANVYLVPLEAIFVALGILAVSPVLKRKAQSKDEEY